MCHYYTFFSVRRSWLFKFFGRLNLYCFRLLESVARGSPLFLHAIIARLAITYCSNGAARRGPFCNLQFAQGVRDIWTISTVINVVGVWKQRRLCDVIALRNKCLIKKSMMTHVFLLHSHWSPTYSSLPRSLTICNISHPSGDKMFVSRQKTNKSAELVEEARAAREQRAQEKRRLEAVIMIQVKHCVGGTWISTVAANQGLPVQSFFRRCLCVKHLRAECQREFDEIFRQFSYANEAIPAFSAEDAFSMLRQFLFMFNLKEDRDRFRNVCYYLIASISCEKPQQNFMTVMQKSESVSLWRRIVLMILKICVRYLQPLNPENSLDAKDIVSYSQVIIMLTHPSQWKAVKIPNEVVQKVLNGLTVKWLQELISAGLFPAVQEVLMRGLARSKPSMNKSTLFPLLTLLIRPMALDAFPSEIDKQKAVIRLFTVPGLILHVETICPVFIETFKKQEIFRMWSALMTAENSWKLMREELKTVNAVLSVTANLAYMFWLEKDVSSDLDVLHVVSTIIFLLDLCKELNTNHQHSTAKWHSILGWSADRLDPR